MSPTLRRLHDALPTDSFASRADLMDALYGDTDEPDHRIVKVLICQLRRKGHRIENLRGVGYRLVGDRT